MTSLNRSIHRQGELALERPVIENYPVAMLGLNTARTGITWVRRPCIAEEVGAKRTVCEVWNSREAGIVW